MIYDEAHLINANVLDGAIRGAAARYANKSPSALPTSRISGNSTFCDDRNASFSAKQHRRTRLLMWFTKPALDLV
jgi:hypothetical protein